MTAASTQEHAAAFAPSLGAPSIDQLGHDPCSVT